MHSKDLLVDNLYRLAEIFPNAISESVDANGNLTSAVDFDVLKQEISPFVTLDGRQERFQLDWPGKKQSAFLANSPIAKTLRPDLPNSQNFDSTQNLFIEGDNLDALKLLQETYLGKIKLIYIDPPYNTGNDFVYEDDFAENVNDYLERTNQVDNAGNRLVSNTEANGRFHSDWLSMMYSRLKLARNLLSPDGVIAISIDDNEQARLVQLCCEIFGSSNFVAQVVTQANKGGRDYLPLAQTHEYVVFFAKDYAQAGFYELEKVDESLPLLDDKGHYEVRELRNRNPRFNRSNRPNLYYPFYIDKDNVDRNGYAAVSLKRGSEQLIEAYPRNSIGVDGCWRWGQAKAEASIVPGDPDASQLVAKQTRNGNWNVYEKNRKSTTKAKTIWDETEMRTEAGTREVRRLMGAAYFDHPKSVELVKKVISIATAPGGDDIVLDFFGGSGTTAQAVMSVNAEDGGNRRFVIVQLPEQLEEASEGFRAGYTTISELSRERIRLAGSDIASKESSPNWIQDLGFRALRVDTSNLKENYYKPDEMSQESIALFADSIKEDRSGEDLLFQVMLDLGIDLCAPIQKEFENIHDVFAVSGRSLVAFLGDAYTDSDYQIVADRKPDFVVFLDRSFANDASRINAEQILKQRSPATSLRVI